MSKTTKEEIESQILGARFKGAAVSVALHGHDAEKCAKYVVKFAKRTDRIIATRTETQTKLASAIKASLPR